MDKLSVLMFNAHALERPVRASLPTQGAPRGRAPRGRLIHARVLQLGDGISDRYDVLTTVAPVLATNTADQTRWGGTVGAGVEVGFAPNWSVGVEYDHLFMQRKNVTFLNNGLFGPAGTFFGADRIRQDVDLATVRINYRWDGPVVGNY